MAAKRKTKTTKSKRTPARPRKSGAKTLSLRGLAPSITVSDIHRSLAWYCDVLGFKVKQRWERDGALMGAELTAGGVTWYLGQDDWQKGRDRVKFEGLRLYCYCGTRRAVDQLAAAIKARGGTLGSEPKDEWGVRSFSLADPDGCKITFSSES